MKAISVTRIHDRAWTHGRMYELEDEKTLLLIAAWLRHIAKKGYQPGAERRLGVAAKIVEQHNGYMANLASRAISSSPPERKKIA